MASNFRVLAYDETPLGPLCLRRRQLLSKPDTTVIEVTLNHEFLMSSLYTESERALATLALDLHDGSELRVLIGGLGLGYTASAALESERVAAVTVVELFPEVVRWMDDGLLPLSRILKRDPRLDVEVDDFFRRVAEPAVDRFDVILVDIDHAPDERLDGGPAGFYDRRGLGALRDHLTPGGVLAVWSSADNEEFMRELRTIFADARAQPVTFLNEMVDEETTDWIFLAH